MLENRSNRGTGDGSRRRCSRGRLVGRCADGDASTVRGLRAYVKIAGSTYRDVSA